MAGYPNGQIPTSALDPVPADNGQTAYLLPDAARSFHDVRARCLLAHGWAPVVTSAGDGFRSYARQVNVFLQRYGTSPATVVQAGRRITDRRVWNGIPYYRHTGPAAAIPGTSNHGKGATVDIAHLRYATKGWRELAPILTAAGWSNAEGASINEPWHWNYLRAAVEVVNTNTLPGVTIPVLPGVAPVPLEPEEDDDMRPHLMYHPDGPVAYILPMLGQVQILHRPDEPAALLGAGMADPDLTVDLRPTKSSLIWDMVVDVAHRAGKYIP